MLVKVHGRIGKFSVRNHESSCVVTNHILIQEQHYRSIVQPPTGHARHHKFLRIEVTETVNITIHFHSGVCCVSEAE